MVNHDRLLNDRIDNDWSISRYTRSRFEAEKAPTFFDVALKVNDVTMLWHDGVNARMPADVQHRVIAVVGV